MTELAFPYLSLMVAVPLLAALANRIGGLRVTRGVAVAAACIDLGLSIGALAQHIAVPDVVFTDPLDPLRWLIGRPVFRLDGLSAVFLVFVAAIALVAVTVAPRSAMRAHHLRQNLFTQATMIAMFATRDPWVIAVLWCLGLVPPLLALRAAGPAGRPALRVFALYMGVCAAAFVGGVALMGAQATAGVVGSALLVIAVLIRKGITPLHSWLPELFEHVPLGVSTMFSTPQVSAYVAATLVLPSEPAAVLGVVGIASLLTALYGSAMALVQSDARRAYGFLFMSQSAVVMLGLGCFTVPGVTGGLLLWLSSGLSLAGLGLSLWVLEARRGRLHVDRFHGGYERSPLLGASFLIFGIGTVGFPGTLGFIGQELLLDGAVQEYAVFSVAYVLASALAGLAVMRMYFALFTGAPARGGQLQRLRRREQLGFSLLGVALLAFGLWPRPLVDSQAAVAQALLAARGPAPEHDHLDASPRDPSPPAVPARGAEHRRHLDPSARDPSPPALPPRVHGPEPGEPLDPATRNDTPRD